MRVKDLVAAMTGALALASCAMRNDGAAPAPAAGSAMATMSDATGAPRGTARFEPVDGGLRLVYDGEGLPPGVHGIHVHAVGRCDAPDFQTAGPHWNPAGRQHGRANPAGPHQGDLANLTVAADGRVHYEALLLDARLVGGMLDADGAALLVHAAADDDRTDPSGNSGARIACGVIAAG